MQGNVDGVLNEAGDCRRLATGDQRVDLFDLVALKGDGEFGGGHTKYHTMKGEGKQDGGYLKKIRQVVMTRVCVTMGTLTLPVRA